MIIDQGSPSSALSFCVGLVGHRDLAPDACIAIEARLKPLLMAIAGQVHRTAHDHSALFGNRPPALVTLSQLAAGADQLGARIALACGFAIHAVLPFERSRFLEDFADRDARSMFEVLADQAELLWHIPYTRTKNSYQLAGEVTVALADLVIAIGDGLPSRGRGGTADIVDYAVRRGVPIFHIPSNGVELPRILWAGLNPTRARSFDRESVPREVFEEESFASLLQLLLLSGEHRSPSL